MTSYHHRAPVPRPASLKQLAYLRYMNVSYPSEIGEPEAHALIRKAERVANYEQWCRLVEKKCAWRTDRFILHPRLFLHEFQVYYHQELPVLLRAHLVHHMPSTMRWPTLGTVRECMKMLSKSEPDWWHSATLQDHFMEYYLQWDSTRRGKSEPKPEALWDQLKGAISVLSGLAPELMKPAKPQAATA